MSALSQGGAATRLAIGPELTIAHAATLRETLVQTLAGLDGDLQLELGGVSDFDSSGVQLLLATQLSVRRRGHALCLHAPSAAVRDALAHFGLQQHFETQEG